MLTLMVQEFRDMQHRLAEMLDECETPEFKQLDGRITRIFDAIYRHEPETPEEARTMARLFLDLIDSNDTGDNLHLIDRLRAIVGDHAFPCPLPLEIAHGAGI